MSERRSPTSETTPAKEDAGLFTRAPRGLEVALVPRTMRNQRRDLLVRGFLEHRRPVFVVFAGRREMMARPVERHLCEMLIRARRRYWMDVEIDRIRLPVWVDGTWRRRFIRDVAGWQQGEHHLIAARWSVSLSQGSPFLFGQEPVR